MERKAIEVNEDIRVVVDIDGGCFYERRGTDALGSPRWEDVCPSLEAQVDALREALCEVLFPPPAVSLTCSADTSKYVKALEGLRAAGEPDADGWRTSPLPRGEAGERIEIEWEPGETITGVREYAWSGRRWEHLGGGWTECGNLGCMRLRWRYLPSAPPDALEVCACPEHGITHGKSAGCGKCAESDADGWFSVCGLPEGGEPIEAEEEWGEGPEENTYEWRDDSWWGGDTVWLAGDKCGEEGRIVRWRRIPEVTPTVQPATRRQSPVGVNCAALVGVLTDSYRRIRDLHEPAGLTRQQGLDAAKAAVAAGLAERGKRGWYRRTPAETQQPRPKTIIPPNVRAHFTEAGQALWRTRYDELIAKNGYADGKAAAFAWTDIKDAHPGEYTGRKTP